MAPQPFTWGMGGQQVASPQQAARQRAIADALVAQSSTPASNWGEGFGDVTAALTGTILGHRVDEAEAAGQQRAGALFANLAMDSNPEAIIAALTSPDAAWGTDAQTSIASALLNSSMERNDPLYQLRIQQAQADLQNTLSGANNRTTSFGTPIWGTDPNGNPVFGTLDNAGNFNVTQTPEGFSFGKDPIRLDSGTEYTLLDPVTRQPIGTIPKDIAGAAAQQVIGTTTAEQEMAAPGQIAQADTALDLIDQIRNHPEKPWATGFSAGVGGNMVPGTGRFGFQNVVDQAKSGAFLTAIQEMKGLGALSNAEGQAATQAITRLNTSLSETDFDKALADYEAIVKRGRDRAARRVQVDDNGNERPATAQPTSPSQSSPNEGWQDIGNGVRIRPIGN